MKTRTSEVGHKEKWHAIPRAQARGIHFSCMKNASIELGLIIKIAIALAAVFLIGVLVYGALKSQGENLEGNDILTKLGPSCEAKSYLPGMLDTDKDGIINSCDNCQNPSNDRRNRDQDSDGLPDVCDKQKTIPGTFENDCIKIISSERKICSPQA